MDTNKNVGEKVHVANMATEEELLENKCLYTSMYIDANMCMVSKINPLRDFCFKEIAV